MNQNKKVLFFYADWCVNSTKMLQKIKKINEQLKNDIEFKYFNINKDIDIFKRYNISEVPKILLTDNDKILESYTGLILTKPIRKKIKDFIKEKYD